MKHSFDSSTTSIHLLRLIFLSQLMRNCSCLLVSLWFIVSLVDTKDVFLDSYCQYWNYGYRLFHLAVMYFTVDISNLWSFLDLFTLFDYVILEIVLILCIVNLIYQTMEKNWIFWIIGCLISCIVSVVMFSYADIL